MTPLLLSKRRAARMLGIGRSGTLEELIAEGKIRVVMLAGRARVPLAEVERHLREHGPCTPEREHGTGREPLDVVGAPDVPGVYFVASPGTPLVKIGVSSESIKKRVRGLQAACPLPLVLLAWVHGNRYDERDEHRRWASFRKHGEWFRLEGELAAYIETLKVRA